MRICKNTFLYIFFVINSIWVCAQTSMVEVNSQLATGWNTWNNNSVLSHVRLPDGLALNIGFKWLGEGGGSRGYYQRSFLPNVNRTNLLTFGKFNEYNNLIRFNRSEKVKLGLRSDDGSFTSLELVWANTHMTIETADDNGDLIVLITPDVVSDKVGAVIELGYLWNRPGEVYLENSKLVAGNGSDKIYFHTINKVVEDKNIDANSPYIVIPLAKKEILIYSGKNRTLEQAKQILTHQRTIQENRAKQFPGLDSMFLAIQQSLAWNTIFDAENNRVITPVSRFWSMEFGGWVLFDWDTYFASYMFSLFNKELAYANAFHITKSITRNGFIPNYASAYGFKSYDRSQPPVGSFVIREIYRKYKEKWFLEEVYNDLLSWNRWWEKNRDNKGYLSYGSNKIDSVFSGNHRCAAWESGLDNSPIYDNVPYNPKISMLELADVGLLSLYLLDCEALEDISVILGRKQEAAEIRVRANKYTQKLSTLWNKKDGIYYNLRTDIVSSDTILTPANLYPLFTEGPDSEQAKLMINKHFLNPDEFLGTYMIPSCARNETAFHGEYWRGRIWGPMNLLVYFGLTRANHVGAKALLADKSKTLYMKSWKKERAVYENYNCITGEGSDVLWSDSYYTWGSLLGFISFLENGFVPYPFDKIQSEVH